MKPYVIISIATYENTAGKGFWSKFMGLIKNFDPDLCPDYFGYSETDLIKKLYPFSDLFEDYDKFSSPMISQSRGGPKIKSFRTIFWRHTKVGRSEGEIYHPDTRLDGTKLCATIRMKLEWKKNVDYDDFFKRLLKISNPILATCHSFTLTEASSPNVTYAFKEGIMGQNKPFIDDIPQRLFINSDQAKPADIEHFKSCGYSSQKIANGIYLSHHLSPELSHEYFTKFDIDRAKLKNLIGDETEYYKKPKPKMHTFIRDGVMYHEPLDSHKSESEKKALHTYDKAKWHYEADDFPTDKPEAHGYTHTGFYVTWLAEKGLMSEDYEKDVTKSLKSKRKQGPNYLYQILGGALFDSMLSEEGNAFAKHYFDFDSGLYLHVYQELLGKDLESLYDILPTWENYDVLKPVLDAHFETWKSSQSEVT